MKTRTELRTFSFYCAVVMLLAAVIAPDGFAQEQNPFAGTWRANISNRSAIRTIYSKAPQCDSRFPPK